MNDKSQYDETVELYFPVLQQLGRSDLIDAIRATRHDPSRRAEVLEELKRLSAATAETAQKSREAVARIQQWRIEDMQRQIEDMQRQIDDMQRDRKR